MTVRPHTPAQLRDAYRRTCDRIAEAALKAGRSPQDVLLVAVTKYAAPDQIRILAEMGQVDFGENRVQQLVQRAAQLEEYLARKRLLGHALEATESVPAPGTPGNSPIGASRPAAGAKRETTRSTSRNGSPRTSSPSASAPSEIPEPKAQLASKSVGTLPGVRWHMIGHLQRNKVKLVVPVVRLIHSVDTLRVAEELQAFGVKTDRMIDVLLEVNASGETSKYGVALPAAAHLAEQIDSMVNLRLRGLMTMAPYSDDPEDARPTFARVAELFHELKSHRYASSQFNILSMGMSGDFETAIAEGANVVRIGRALFGEGEPDDLTETTRPEPTDEDL